MKHTTILVLLCICTLFFTVVGFVSTPVQSQVVQITVNEFTGNDQTGGVNGLSFETFERAQQEVNTMLQNPATNNQPIEVMLSGDVYVDSTVLIDEYNTLGFPISYISDPLNPARIHGAKEYTQGWQLYENSIYVIELPEIIEQPRDIYINDSMQTRSTSRGDGAYSFSQTGPFEITQNSGSPVSGFNRPFSVEFEGANVNYWKHPIQRVESTNGSVLSLYDHTDLKDGDGTPNNDIEFKGSDFIHALNAYELINEHGEWYFNTDTNQLFLQYSQNPNGLKLSIPTTETLLRLENVENISFEGIQFTYSAFNTLVNSIGLQTMGQGGIINTNTSNTKGFAEGSLLGAISMDYTSNITIRNSIFNNISSTAIECGYGCINHTLEQNIFENIGGGAILYGATYGIDTPQKETRSNSIRESIFTNIGSQYFGSSAINILYGKQNNIQQNTITNVPYTAISVGWGWDPNSTLLSDNTISQNNISNYLTKVYDGAAIYLLSNAPGTAVYENYIHGAVNDHAALYPDDGSSNMSLYSNVIDSPTKFWAYLWRFENENRINNIELFDNFIREGVCDTQFGTFSTDGAVCEIIRGTNTYQNNNLAVSGEWPAGALSIIQAAGVSDGVINPQVRISNIIQDGGGIVVDFSPFNYTTHHTHFYFDTEAQTVTNKMHFSTDPYQISSVPQGASQICAIVANNGAHTIIPETGNCIALPLQNISNISYSLSVMLSGVYNQSNNEMNTYLWNNNVLPSNQPYNNAPYNYIGSESITANSLVAGNFVDWVLISLYSQDRQTQIDQYAALVDKNGVVVNGTGNSLFTAPTSSPFHITITHRNHLAITTQNPILSTNSTVDFTDLNTVKGQNVQELSSGIFGMRAGNATSDGSIDSSDRNALRNTAESSQIYSNFDINLDGVIDALDRNSMRQQPESFEDL